MKLVAEPLTPEAFAPFGNVIELRDTPDKMINQGLCGRHHDLADLDLHGGRAGISLFDAEPRSLPYRLEMVERHPDGAQAFLSLTGQPFFLIVALPPGLAASASLVSVSAAATPAAPAASPLIVSLRLIPMVLDRSSAGAYC